MLSEYLLPRITDLCCSYGSIMAQRQKIVPLARGRVLEIGVGSGLNLRFYDPKKVERVFALDPSDGMLKLARERTGSLPFEVDLLRSGAEQIPLEDDSVDSILTTFTMCSIDELPLALREMRRVLRPGGTMFYCEHGLAPDPKVARWQRRLNPTWKRLAGGCNLNRDIPGLIAGGGFALQQESREYISRFKLASYVYRGIARPL